MSENKKICPVMSIGNDVDFLAHCQEEKCAWWNNDKCSVLAIAHIINSGITTRSYQLIP